MMVTVEIIGSVTVELDEDEVRELVERQLQDELNQFDDYEIRNVNF